MDKELIQRLAREAGLWPLQMTEDTPAGTVAQRQAELDGWCQRFATLVAEECAKIADLGHVRRPGIAFMMHPDAQEMARQIAGVIRERYGPPATSLPGSLATIADQVIAEEIARDQAGRKQPFGLDALVSGDGSLPPGFKGAGPNNFTFRSLPTGISAEELTATGKAGFDLVQPGDWRSIVLRNIRETQIRLDPPGGLRVATALQVAVKKRSGEQPTAFTFKLDWLRTASDEDILRAIDASEAPR